MTNITKASEAAGNELGSQIIGRPLREMDPRTAVAIRTDAARILSVAMPDLLDALADEAGAEAMRLFDSGANTDEAMRAMNQRLRARDWLRAKAEEVRQ